MKGLRRHWPEVLIGVGIAAGPVLTYVQRTPQSGSSRFEIPAVLVIMLPLLAWRRFPIGVPVAIGVALAVASFFDGSLMYDIAPALAGVSAVFLVALVRERWLAYVGLALAIVVVAVTVRNNTGGGADDFAFICLGLFPFWLLGRALRHKQDEAETAAADERTRIARELHDVVGHSVSVMTIQAAAVRRLLRPEQAREREALLTVEQTGREALAEMRRVVGVLRARDERASLAPQPSLREVEKLAEQARAAGLDVDVRKEGDPVDLPAGVELAAYRLVQEGLTNALKHAHARRAEVVIGYREDGLEITVTDDGRGPSAVNGAGHGLDGLRERLALYGGELEASPADGGGFTLRGTLPIR